LCISACVQFVTFLLKNLHIYHINGLIRFTFHSPGAPLSFSAFFVSYFSYFFVLSKYPTQRPLFCSRGPVNMTSAFAQHKLVQKPSKLHRVDCLASKLHSSRVAHLNWPVTKSRSRFSNSRLLTLRSHLRINEAVNRLIIEKLSLTLTLTNSCSMEQLRALLR